MLFPVMISSKLSPTKQSSRAPAQHRCEELSSHLHDFTFRMRLGRGAFGQVFLAETNTHSASRHGNKEQRKRLVAIKIVRRTMLEKESTRALARAEAENLRRVSESGSLFFTQLRETFCDPHNLYIVTDYLAGGTLRDEMTRRRRIGAMSNDRILVIMAQLVEALAQLRALRIVHRDLKPDNILLDAHGNVVLADFGLSRRFEMAPSTDSLGSNDDERRQRERSALTCNSRLSLFKLRREKDNEEKSTECSTDSPRDAVENGDVSPADASKSCMTDTGCGTLAYAAPEMHRGEAYTFSADAYSLGVVFHELLLDRLPPYPPASVESIDSTDVQWFLDPPRNNALRLSIEPTALHLLTSLMSLDPLKRISFPELRFHLFFAGVHWPTLAAHAYTLPAHHSPPTRPLKLARLNEINPGIFVDPLVVLEDGPDGILEEVYNVQDFKVLTWRPGEKRGWLNKVRTARMILDLKGGMMQAWDFVRNVEGRVRRRDWAKDVNDGRELFVKLVGSSSSTPVTYGTKDNDDINIKIEIHVEQEGCAEEPTHVSPIIVDSGHGSSTSLPELVPVHSGGTEPVRPRVLRRVTERLPPKSRLTFSATTRSLSTSSMQDEVNSDLLSTIAIFSPSFTSLPSPEAARLSAEPPPAPLESTHSSSSPFPSSFSLSFFLTRALEYVLPSSSSPTPSPSRDTKARAGSVVQGSLHSSCPSLLPSASCSTAASSSLPTPERGNSYFPGMLQVHEQGAIMGGIPGAMKSGLPFVENEHGRDSINFFLDKLPVRRRASSVL